MFKSLLKKARVETNTVKDLTLTEELKRLRVHLHNGKILLRQWEQEFVQAHVHVEATGGYAERLEGQGTDVCWTLEQRGNELVFEEASLSMFDMIIGSLTVNVELFVPKQHLSGRVESHNGRVQIEQFAGDLRVTTHNGALRLTEIVGSADVKSHNGNVEVEQVDGDLSVEVHNGRIEIERVNGRVKASTHNGKISASECSEQLTLETHNGAIEAKSSQAPTARWDIRTGNGAIDVELARDAQVEFDIETAFGKISGDVVPLQSNAIHQRVKFSTGNGGPTMCLESKMGAIRINTFR
ncbi:MAG: DUF4097 family beta strand repeat-containing protein [Tumebacillaceae bacterium]